MKLFDSKTTDRGTDQGSVYIFHNYNASLTREAALAAARDMSAEFNPSNNKRVRTYIRDAFYTPKRFSTRFPRIEVISFNTGPNS